MTKPRGRPRGSTKNAGKTQKQLKLEKQKDLNQTPLTTRKRTRGQQVHSPDNFDSSEINENQSASPVRKRTRESSTDSYVSGIERISQKEGSRTPVIKTVDVNENNVV